MLKKILVPLDGSELAERALAYATALSVPTAARLLLVRSVIAHTLPGIDAREPQVQALAEAEAYLRQIADGLAERGFVTEIATPYGDSPTAWIVEEAELRHADVIVMTTHGRRGPGHWIFGSVAEAVVSRSPVPVLLLRAWEPRQRELLFEDQPRLVVPLDGSVFAEAALPVALGLVDDLGAELVLVRVVDPTPYGVREAEDYLQSVSTKLLHGRPGLKVRTLAESGDPPTGIASAAESSRAALVIMATHGRTGILRAALGSTAGRVLGTHSAPLVLVRPGGPTRATATGRRRVTAARSQSRAGAPG